MAEINHEIKIQGSLEKTFKALTEVSGLKSWHTASIDGKSGIDQVLSFHGKNTPAFVWKVIELEPNKKLIWECVKGPGNSAGTKAFYALSKTNDDRTLVEFSHTSWLDEKDNFRKCNTLWGILLHHLKNYVETGKTDPAIL